MPLVGFEPTVPVFERAKTVHALDRAATVIGSPLKCTQLNIKENIIINEKIILEYASEIYCQNNKLDRASSGYGPIFSFCELD
jgi:hypothetical protein